ncbi:MAG: polynucleotide kinase [Dolichospermum sp.]
MTKILFLDLDGTVRRTKSGATFITDPYDQELIPGAGEAIARYHNWLIIGITNQGGVKAGFKSFEACLQEQRNTLALIPTMIKIFFCPGDGEGFYRLSRYYNHPLFSDRAIDFGNFRKPNPGMLNYGKTLYPNNAYMMVGDRPEDKQCADNANVPFMWAKAWRNDKQDSKIIYLHGARASTAN